MTRHQPSAIIKKRKTLIEAVQDNKSQDGYVIRTFFIVFSRESPNQKRKTKYALASQNLIIYYSNYAK
jgi:ribosomal protein S3AE